MEPFSPNLCEEIAAALEGSAVALASQTEADFRWGCIFYDTHGNRALTIFFDASDWSGLLDGTPVVSNGEVVRLLERRCSCLREGDYRPQRTGKR